MSKESTRVGESRKRKMTTRKEVKKAKGKGKERGVCQRVLHATIQRETGRSSHEERIALD